MVIKKASVILLAGLLASSTALAGDPLPVVSDLNINLEHMLPLKVDLAIRVN